MAMLCYARYSNFFTGSDSWQAIYVKETLTRKHNWIYKKIALNQEILANFLKGLPTNFPYSFKATHRIQNKRMQNASLLRK